MTDLVPGISLHMMVKNPPMDRLAALVAFLQPYIKELVLVNTGMPDADKATILSWQDQCGMSLDVRIVDTPFTDFATTRNKGLVEHRCEWTLVLDPDEFPSLGMMAHIIWATSPQGAESHPDAVGWVFWTYGWSRGRLAEFASVDWHVRLFKTAGSYFYRPVHEVLVVGGYDEMKYRTTMYLPHAPHTAYLLHSQMPDDGTKHELYSRLADGR